MASVAKPQAAGARAELYRRMEKENLSPLWEVLHALVPRQPASPCVPALWKYRDVRPYVEESGRVISAREAVRRVLVLENPGMRGESRITRSLYCGLQLILPGEVAPSHRHTQSALRFIVEGSGAYTAVDGERATMRPGDFIVTPAWTWHDHGNPGGEPVVWMDGLDIPMTHLFESTFAEDYPEETQPVTRPEGASAAFSFPYARSRGALESLAARGAPDACHGWKLEYLDPASGRPPMPTMGAFLQLLPKGFVTRSCRSTDGAVFSVAEGSGRVRIGEASFDYEPRDTFVVPPWAALRLEAREECVLFSFSDRPAQQALGLWREQRG